MFLGENRHTLDPKGRIIMPSRLRQKLGSVFYATKGLDHCIFIYTIEEWEKLEDKIQTLPFMKGDVRSFTRVFFSGACELEMDRQGRVLLPANLKDHAEIDKDVVIAGVGSRLELWSVERWEEYQAEAAKSFEEITEKLVEFNL
jgi:MraZ protein